MGVESWPQFELEKPISVNNCLFISSRSWEGVCRSSLGSHGGRLLGLTIGFPVGIPSMGINLHV